MSNEHHNKIAEEVNAHSWILLVRQCNTHQPLRNRSKILNCIKILQPAVLVAEVALAVRYLLSSSTADQARVQLPERKSFRRQICEMVT